jgi:hypothetical protein
LDYAVDEAVLDEELGLLEAIGRVWHGGLSRPACRLGLHGGLWHLHRDE